MSVALLPHCKVILITQELIYHSRELTLATRLTTAAGYVVPAKGDSVIGTFQVLQLLQLVALQTVGTLGGN